jgi:hypothetical protein
MRTAFLGLLISMILLACCRTHAAVLAHWRFEEGSDGSGATGNMPATPGHVNSLYNAGSMNGSRAAGAPAYVSDSTPGSYILGVGENNLALYFDGSDAFSITTNTLLNFGAANSVTGQFTIEFFLRVNPVPNNGRSYRILQKRDQVGSIANVGYDTWVWTGADNATLLGQVPLTVTDSSGGFRQPRTSTRVDDGEWHHLALQRDYDGTNTNWRVWVDYAISGTGTDGAVGSLANGGDLWVGRGRSLGSTHYLVGWLDEIRISDQALFSDQFLRVPEPSAMPVLSFLACMLARRRHLRPVAAPTAANRGAETTRKTCRHKPAN